MATETISGVKHRLEGNKRAARFRFTVTAGETTGDLNTPLGRVEHATIVGIDTQDTKVSLTKNSQSTTENVATYNGWLHFEGAVAEKTYQIDVVGV